MLGAPSTDLELVASPAAAKAEDVINRLRDKVDDFPELFILILFLYKKIYQMHIEYYKSMML